MHARIFWMMATCAWWCPCWKELTEPLQVNNHTELSIFSARCVKQIVTNISFKLLKVYSKLHRDLMS